MTDALCKAHDKLQSGVAEIVSADDWKRMRKRAIELRGTGIIPTRDR
jgi:hypothetical protein